MNLIRLIRGLRDVKSKINQTENKIESGELKMNWKELYAKHKTKIWATGWVILTYFSTPIVNDAISGLPVLADVKDRVAVVEKDLAEVKKDLEEIKVVLTPPSQ